MWRRIGDLEDAAGVAGVVRQRDSTWPGSEPSLPGRLPSPPLLSGCVYQVSCDVSIL